MSVMIFNIVFQMLLDSLIDTHSQFCQRKRIGYAFKNAQITVFSPSFAEDITLTASDVTDCQQSINTMQEIVTCSIRCNCDPLLTVNGDAILCVGQDTKSDFMFKILGRQLQWN